MTLLDFFLADAKPGRGGSWKETVGEIAEFPVRKRVPVDRGCAFPMVGGLAGDASGGGERVLRVQMAGAGVFLRLLVGVIA